MVQTFYYYFALSFKFQCCTKVGYMLLFYFESAESPIPIDRSYVYNIQRHEWMNIIKLPPIYINFKIYSLTREQMQTPSIIAPRIIIIIAPRITIVARAHFQMLFNYSMIRVFLFLAPTGRPYKQPGMQPSIQPRVFPSMQPSKQPKSQSPQQPSSQLPLHPSN